MDTVTVVVVDDTDDIRFLLRTYFERDSRFEVVGEGADGNEAVALAATLQPDLLVLDRQMPNLGGIEAMPEIRRVSPATAIVLYTAHADPGTTQAALDAGAIEVLEKAGPGFVDRLVDGIVQRVEGADTVEVKVGPVSALAARIWVANTTTIIDAVAAHPEVFDAAIPRDVLELFRSFLLQWAAVAESTEEFRWVARARVSDFERIVDYWATIDRMTDEQLAQLGVSWSPPEGQPFFQALTDGVLDALLRHEQTQRVASRLSEQWAPYRSE